MPIRHSHSVGTDPGAFVLRPSIAADNTAHSTRAGSSAHAPFGLPTATPGVHSSPSLPGPRNSPEDFRAWGRAAGEYAASFSRHRGGEVILDFQKSEISPTQFRHLIAGALEGINDPGEAAVGSAALSSAEGNRAVELRFVTAPAFSHDIAELLLYEELAIRRATRLAVELTNARSNQLTPELFAGRAREIAQRLGLGFRVTGAAELRNQGYGGITAIGQGSANPPMLVELWYSPDSQPGEEPPQGAVAIAGKGVTFDSGGLSLKPASSMYSMHTDCAGAATVLAALAAHAELRNRTPVYVALPLVENIPGPNAIRPGDVVTMRNGIGIEIIDTDFEGRVIIADAVAKLSESQPQALLSFATLTQQIQDALGSDIAGLFGRDEDLAHQVLAAAEVAGEAMWPMPWATRYADQLVSSAPGATLRNHPLRESGRAITAALFIGEFVPRGIPFAHIDFAGPTVRNTASGPIATGYGVRTIVELLRDWA